jgi:molybdate/tungstate transport system substrate-binding protein
MRRPLAVVAVILLACWSGCDSKPAPARLRVFVADALLRPLNAVAEAFMKENPGIEVVQIPSGSVLAAKKITEGNDAADVLAVADYMVIEKLMRPAHADWYICFATNEIVIAYTDASKGSVELTDKNWFDVLSREGVTVGASNPLHDPCGYWTELCWRLADLHYPALPGGETISQRMTRKCGPPADRRTDAEEMLQLVESAGGVDYVFVYRSQARQHHLQSVRLPPEVSLGDPAMAETYRKVSIELPGREPATTTRKTGEAIVFALTIPKVARRSDLAEKYVSFILSGAGREILVKEYIQAVDQPWTFDPDKVPAALRSGLGTRNRSPATPRSPGDSHAR